MLAINGNGHVLLDNGHGPLATCSLNGTVDGVSPATCQGWYSTLLTARTARKNILVYYSTDYPSVPPSTSCATFAAWNWKVPYFLVIDP